MTLKLVDFSRDHFVEYKYWFDDPILNEHLGPAPDEEWLDAVITDPTHRQYSVFRTESIDLAEHRETMVSVAGVQCPVENHPKFVVTDIAIKPCFRQQGIGKKVIADLLKLHPPAPGESWAAFVEASNPGAMTFFEKLGWARKSATADEHGMIEYCLPPQNE